MAAAPFIVPPSMSGNRPAQVGLAGDRFRSRGAPLRSPPTLKAGNR